jgi:hypothetical protein
MSAQGIIIIDILGLGLILLIINLVRTHRLHVGYAIIWLLSVFSLMIMISIPPLLEFVPKAVGAIFPASALSLLAFVFIFLVLILFSVQLSLISARQIELAQAQALNDLLAREQHAREERFSDNQDG